MPTYTCRAQTVLTEEQYSLLQSLSEESGKPVSVLIREAIEQVYLQEAVRQRRQAAVERLLALKAPVADWEQVEEEIVRGALDE
jgi:predicted DNA-binding protein